MTAESAIIQYWNEINNGGINAGKWIRLLYDVILQGLQEKRWFYDHYLAENAMMFIERYSHHYRGKLAPGRLVLDLWERACISLIFGIVDADGKPNPENPDKPITVIGICCPNDTIMVLSGRALPSLPVRLCR